MKLFVALGLFLALAAQAHPKAKKHHSKLNAAAPTYRLKAYPEKHALGLKKTPQSEKYLLKKKAEPHLLKDAPIPASTDLTALVSPPENQGQCGSCWAFSLTKALRSAWMLAGKDPSTLAFNYLIHNCGPGPAEYGCGGGNFDAGENFLNNAGPWSEASDPYQGGAGRCKSGLPIAATAKTFDVVGSGNNAPTFKDLAQAISAKHMLSVDVAVAGRWGNYDGGIYNTNDAGPGSINHMIDMVGYNCETSVDAQGNCAFNSQGQPVNGDGWLKVENNWGTSWGENGYMRTRWGMNAIANTAMYFTVDYTPPPPPVPPAPPVPPVAPCETCRKHHVEYTGFLSFLHMPWNGVDVIFDE